MSIQLPEGPGRRAIVKGGLAAAVVAALSSCGIQGAVPAFAQAAAPVPVHPHGVFASLWSALEEAGANDGVTSNSKIYAALEHHFISNGVRKLPARFIDGKVSLTVKTYRIEREKSSGDKVLVLLYSVSGPGLPESEDDSVIVLNREHRQV